MTREEALLFVSHCVDDAQTQHPTTNIPDHARLVGWQCGFEPMFVAVWSYLNVRLNDDDAEELASELLNEHTWFTHGKVPADYVI